MYLFISDIHLGSPLFNLREPLLRLLTDYKYSRIYIIGDIIDEWETDVKDILDEYKDVVDCINNSPKFVVIVRGNHDPDPTTLKSIFPNKMVCTRYETSLRNRKVLMIHGDEFDYKIVRHITLSRLLYPVQWIFERLGINLNGWFRDLYHSLAQKYYHKKYNELVMDIEIEFVKKYTDYDILIMGHTHKEKLVPLQGNRYYVNTGSLVHHPVYTEFDEHTGIFTIKKLKDDNYNV